MFAAVSAFMLVGTGALSAHPMPNSVISIAHQDNGLTLDVAVPESELTLAMNASHEVASATATATPAVIDAYLRRHLSIRSSDGVLYPYTIANLSRVETVDENVGTYSELHVTIGVPAARGFDSRDFTLAYDAVMHQIPNHVAVVQIVDDFRNGILPDSPAQFVGTLGFDFQTNAVAPLHIQSDAGSTWQGVRAVASRWLQYAVGAAQPFTPPFALLIAAVFGGRRWSLRSMRWGRRDGSGSTSRQPNALASASQARY